ATFSTLSAKFRVKLSATLASGSISVEAIGFDLSGNPVGSPASVPLALNTVAWQTADVTYVLPNPLPANVYLPVKFAGVPNTTVSVDAVVFTWSSNDFTGSVPRDPVREPYDLITSDMTTRIDKDNANIAEVLSTINATTTTPGTNLLEPPNSPDETSRLFEL